MTAARDRLVELHAAGFSMREAAVALGCSRNTVAGVWRRSGLRRKRPNLSPEEIEQQRETDSLANRMRKQEARQRRRIRARLVERRP